MQGNQGGAVTRDRERERREREGGRGERGRERVITEHTLTMNAMFLARSATLSASAAAIVLVDCTVFCLFVGRAAPAMPIHPFFRFSCFPSPFHPAPCVFHSVAPFGFPKTFWILRSRPSDCVKCETTQSYDEPPATPLKVLTEYPSTTLAVPGDSPNHLCSHGLDIFDLSLVQR